jgi:hypothetical protein
MKPALFIPIAVSPFIFAGAYFYFQNAAFNERTAAAAKRQALIMNQPPPSDPKQAIKTTGNETPLAPPPVLERVPAPATVSDVTSQDEELYDTEIHVNLKKAEINNLHFREIKGELEEAAKLSSAERAKSPVIADALATTKRAAHFADLAGCLNDQRKRGVGYYQGKSTCTALFPDP